MKEKSIVQVYTGDGKGKTTAAFGLALRAAGRGMKTLVIQFLKGKKTGEIITVEKIPEITVERYGSGRFFKKGEETEEDIQEAKKGLKRGKNGIREDTWDIIVLDEINIALDFELLDIEDILALMDINDNKELILTGRNAPDRLLENADLVTYMDDIKHPYEEDIEAREGIEY